MFGRVWVCLPALPSTALSSAGSYLLVLKFASLWIYQRGTGEAEKPVWPSNCQRPVLCFCCFLWFGIYSLWWCLLRLHASGYESGFCVFVTSLTSEKTGLTKSSVVCYKTEHLQSFCFFSFLLLAHLLTSRNLSRYGEDVRSGTGLGIAHVLLLMG